jgi:heterodisulfide reductase subunit D
MERKKIEVPIMANLVADGIMPEYLFWVGSAGAFDDRYKKVSQAFVKILHYLNISYAVLGFEETDSGDIARRAGNEMLFQMQALMNIETLNRYGIEKIITCDPHDYNVLKNEYPDLGGNYNIVHHTEFLWQLINNKSLEIPKSNLSNKKITYHDPCYLGRANQVYEPPRLILKELGLNIVEMPRNRSFALCCGAGGGQMFKEAEKGNKEVFIERTEEALTVNPEIIVTACPFCMTMMTDGIKYKNQEDSISNKDIAELVAEALGL